jgi:phosphonate transport system substrate-binding protein
MRNSLRSGSLALLLATASCQREQVPEEKRAGAPIIRVTGIPDETPAELIRRFQPMASYLEHELKAKVVYVPVTDYLAAVQGLASEQVDFAWLGGFTFVQAKVMTGGVPIAMRSIDREFRSVFIANASSGITKLEDLKGHTFTFGAKSSTSGHLMPRHFLIHEGKINPESDFKGLPLYSGAHDATASLVESGKVDAGALSIEVWERMKDEKKVDPSRAHVFWTTPPYIDYVWVARVGVDVEIQEKFRRALLKLDYDNPDHRELLDLLSATKFVAAAPHDFEAIEAIARSTGLLK